MSPKQSAYNKIEELVNRFEEQHESYKRSEYNETQTRRDFIDPFFKALGWDMDNENGYAESYREVIHEDRIKISGSSNAPDYSFRLSGGKKLFFVEAKKPSVDVKDEISPAYQIRRYGWSAKLPISIITDFEEFSVYDCTKVPKPSDKASTSRIKYLTYRDYLTEFDFLWNTFSKEQILKGSFDKFVQSDTYKKGTATVDKQFLQSLDDWRKYLASNISLNNKSLDEDEVNFTVQQTINRIIFLRIAEDRGVEPYGTLKEALIKGDYYKNLFEQFKTADAKYNSGLFDFGKDKLSENLTIDNKTIKTILNDLYYPESPYEFSVLSVEILGSSYEQFLGKVIRITPSRQVKIEEKPEVRKAGGVYYTPQYIVDYIVKNTLGKLIDDKTPKEISKIRIVDPACGSGSFLLGAYQYLLDRHKDYYTNNGKTIKVKKDNPLTPEGNLTTNEKKRILLNNIYGVDLDVNAVEVTKLSLLLKCMEGETEASINFQVRMFHERVLPDLDSNIKSGNSLIDTDFYDNQLDFGDDKKIKPFNWERGFPEVFAQGGFDVVIGNPPYYSLSLLEKNIIDYLSIKYKKIHTGYNDIMYYFIYRAVSLLNKKGICGLITSNYFIGNKYAELLRQFLSNHLEEIVNFKNFLVFSGVNIHTCILLLNKISIHDKVTFFEPYRDINKENFIDSFKSLQLNKSDLNKNWLVGKKEQLSIIEKINSQTLLSEISEIEKGSTSGKNKVFTVEKSFAEKRNFEMEILRKNIKNGDIKKYHLVDRGHFLIYIDSSTKIENYPNIYNYLKEHKKELSDRNEVKRNLYDWYRLERPRKKEVFDISEKIVVPYRAEFNRFAYDNSQYFNDGGDIRAIVLINDSVSIKYVLGILNSNLINWFYGFIGKPKGKSREYFNEPLGKIPIPISNLDNKHKKVFHNEIVNLVDNLIYLNNEKDTLNLPSKISQLESKIQYCEDKLNQIVYELYGLTAEEIKIVEGGN